MTRGQRRLHAALWLLLGPITILVIGLSIALRFSAPAREPDVVPKEAAP